MAGDEEVNADLLEWVRKLFVRLGCPDCNSDLHLTRFMDATNREIYMGTVGHDDTCPILKEAKPDGA